MKNQREFWSGIAALVIFAASSVSAQTRVAPSSNPLGPGSAADLLGALPTPPDRYQPGAPLTFAGADGTPVYGPPAGNVIFLARVDATGSNAPVILNGSNSYQATVFSQEFTTSPGTTFVEVNYSTQAAITNGTAYDGVALECRVYQGVGFPTWVPCSATKEQPYLVRQLNVAMPSVQVMASYHGYARVDPSTLTKVEIRVKTLASTVAVAAYNNLIIRY